MGQQRVEAEKKAISVLGCINRSIASGLRVVIVLLYLAHVRLSLLPVLTPPSARSTLANQSKVRRRPPGWSGLEYFSCGERQREQGFSDMAE